MMMMSMLVRFGFLPNYYITEKTQDLLLRLVGGKKVEKKIIKLKNSNNNKTFPRRFFPCRY